MEYADSWFCMGVQEAVKKETSFILIGTTIACVIVVLGFFILHQVVPSYAPFDYTVFVGAIGGLIVAVGNFFWMALTVQKIAGMNQDEDDRARSTMAVSLRYRTLLQLVWVVIAIFVPQINLVSGIIPLFIPSVLIKIRGILSARKGR